MLGDPRHGRYTYEEPTAKEKDSYKDYQPMKVVRLKAPVPAAWEEAVDPYAPMKVSSLGEFEPRPDLPGPAALVREELREVREEIWKLQKQETELQKRFDELTEGERYGNYRNDSTNSRRNS